MNWDPMNGFNGENLEVRPSYGLAMWLCLVTACWLSWRLFERWEAIFLVFFLFPNPSMIAFRTKGA